MSLFCLVIQHAIVLTSRATYVNGLDMTCNICHLLRHAEQHMSLAKPHHGTRQCLGHDMQHVIDFKSCEAPENQFMSIMKVDSHPLA